VVRKQLRLRPSSPNPTVSTHETFVRAEETKLPSNRSFGLVFTAVFLIIGLLPLVSRHTVRAWALIISGVFLAVTLAAPNVLTPLNRLWLRFGLFLHKIVSPVVLGVIFFLAVTPTGLLMRWFKKDILRLRFDPAADTYWIKRDPPGPEPKSLVNQF